MIIIYVYVYVHIRVNISILVVGDASDVIKYDRRTSELSNKPLHMKQETPSTPV